MKSPVDTATISAEELKIILSAGWISEHGYIDGRPAEERLISLLGGSTVERYRGGLIDFLVGKEAARLPTREEIAACTQLVREYEGTTPKIECYGGSDTQTD